MKGMWLKEMSLAICAWVTQSADVIGRDFVGCDFRAGQQRNRVFARFVSCVRGNVSLS